MSNHPATEEFLMLRTHLRATPGIVALPDLVTALTDDVVALSNLVPDAEWETIIDQGTRCLGFGYSALRWLQREAQLLAETAHDIQLFDEWLAAAFASVAESSFGNAFFVELLEWLNSNAPEAVDEFGAAIGNLAEGKTADNRLLESLRRVEQPAEQDLQRMAGDAALLALSRSLHALFHASFNKTLALVGGRSFDGAVLPKLVDALAAEVEGFRGKLRTGQLRLYSALASQQPTDLVAQEACALAGLVELHLPRLAQSQAMAFLAAQALRDHGNGGAAEKLGRAAMRAGALAREALASHVASYRLALELLAPAPSDEVQRLSDQATSLAFDMQIPNGKNVALAELPQVADGAFVEVEGFITGIRVGKASDGKLISWVDLVDESSGANATAVAVYLHLTHTGLTKGAFLRVNGVLRRSSVLNHGQPAVEIDRLSLTDLAKSSWVFAFLQAAAPWFQVWRNALNMYWSVGPHDPPSGESGNEGAGELFYTPFIRSR